MLTYDTPAYMFNVYKNQLSRQTGSRNLTGPKTLPTIWHTYMKLVTKYQISAINSCWEKCDEKYLGTDRQMEWQTDRGKTVYPPPSPPVKRGYNNIHCIVLYKVFFVGSEIQVDGHHRTLFNIGPYGNISKKLFFPEITNLLEPKKCMNKQVNGLLHKIDAHLFTVRGRHGRDRMVVGFTTTCAISVYRD